MSFETIAERWARLVVGHRFKVITACLVATGLVSWGGTRSAFSTDYRIFFPAGDPKLAALDAFEQTFTKTDNIIFVVRPGSGDIFQAEALGAIDALTKGGWRLPFASRVDSPTNFQVARADGDGLAVGELLDRSPAELDLDALEGYRAILTAEPLILGSLLSRDQVTAGVNVTLRLPRQSALEVTQASQAARALAEEVRRNYPGVEVRISGLAMMNDAFMAASVQDMSFIYPLMATGMVGALWYFLGSLSAMAAVVFLILLTSGVAIGAGGWLGYPLTPPSAAAPTIVLTLAVANGVHIVTGTTGGLAAGLSRSAAIVEAVRVNAKSILLTNTTTMIGFLSLNFADAPPFWHLANMTTCGVLAALVLALSLLPALLSLCPLKPRRESNFGTGFARWLSAFVVRARIPLLVGGVILTVGFSLPAFTLRSNDQFVRYFDRSIAFRPDTEFLLEHLSGIYLVDYAIHSGASGGVAEPDYLSQLDAFSTWLRAQPEIAHVYTFSDVIQRLNQTMHRDDPNYYRVPTSRAEASELILLYEMGLPMGLDLTDRLDLDKSTSRLTATVRDVSSAELRALAERSEEWLRDHAPRPMWAEAISPSIIFSHLSDRNTRSMLKGDLVSLLLVSACLLLALRSFGLGLISLIPNLMPMAVAYGLWGIFVGEVNITASAASSIAFGIIVDDTVHFLSKYQLLRDEHGLSNEAALREVLIEVTPAVLVATFALVAGFGVLALSSFEMTSDLGLLTSLICGVGLLTELVFLPALMLTFGAERARPLAREPLPTEADLSIRGES